MKYYVYGMDFRDFFRKIFLPWILSFIIVFCFETLLLFRFFEYFKSKQLIIGISFWVIALLFGVFLTLEGIAILSFFQYFNRHRIKLFCLGVFEKKVVIESNGAKQVILFDDILEVKYHSGRYAEIRGLRIKANEINIGISCLGDRLNLSEKEDDVEQFDQFFNTFEEKTELFLEENGSGYGRNNECIRLKKIKKWNK